MGLIKIFKKIISLFRRKRERRITTKTSYDPKNETFFDVDAHVDPYEKEDEKPQ